MYGHPGGAAPRWWCVMGAERIHHSRPDGQFTQTPNATARDRKLSVAAIGYLIQMLSHSPGWEPETGDQAARRLGEKPHRIRLLLAELERAGYRHRVRRREPGGRFVTEIHYYDVPSRPCLDALTCACCGDTP